MTTIRRRMDVREAADRLGVKVETLYAYVSRGLLASERAADGRRSTFDRDEVERLAARGRPRRSSRGPTVDVSIRTSITDIDGRHLRYRGRDAVELSVTAAFEQVAELLWVGELPDAVPSWGPGRELPYRPGAGTMVDRLRAAVALDACRDRRPPDLGHGGAAELVAEGPGLIATMVGSLPSTAQGPVPRLVLGGSSAGAGTLAGRLTLRLVPRRPPRSVVAAVNAALVLLADHELAASTFAARVAASVRADAHAVVSAGMGPVAGPYHGQASRWVRQVLDAAERSTPAAVVRRLSERPGPVPGVGHGLYPYGDPRADALLGVVLGDAGRSAGVPARRVRLVEELVAEMSTAGIGRPNIDFALGALGHVWSMPPDAGEAVFTVARAAGWLAHAAEEWDRRPVRFRARALYTGP